MPSPAGTHGDDRGGLQVAVENGGHGGAQGGDTERSTGTLGGGSPLPDSDQVGVPRRVRGGGGSPGLLSTVTANLFRIVPWVRYFKRADILILLFEKWGRGYEYGYELLD